MRFVVARCFWLFIFCNGCLMFVVCHVLFVVGCLLSVSVFVLLFGVAGWLFVVCCLLLVVYCMLYAD